MRYAFSTLGVPGMPVADVVRLAAGAGYDGVELRAHPEEPVHPGLLGRERRAVAGRFEDAGVRILCVAGYARVAQAGDDEPVYEELHRLLYLAADLGAPYARVFPGGGDQPRAAADATAARRLGAAAEVAAEIGVRVLLETHDSHPAGADAARVVAAVGHPHVGALWDVMHTWRAGEDPAESYRLLAPYLGYVQVKDIASREDTAPLPLGAGVLPLGDCLGAVRGDPGAWVCWEYEKRRYPQAAELPALLSAGRTHLEALAAR
ncbi:sugar phosphate isomerase/epimerase [Streptomyces sp. CC228A]|uniref:sugar phosphate isomerase/epimerase family protein n=1 Tax=Streptomyces sp. CC228A TaxID=2898186 RepID=UPI001F298244|nr:sugar phosphate isomerase/epimerase family protein [Streptomyces sp. CC228A]